MNQFTKSDNMIEISIIIAITIAAFIFGRLSKGSQSKIIIIGKHMKEEEKQWWIALGIDRRDLENCKVEIE